MRFAHGATRFTILIGSYAIKIARFKTFLLVQRFLVHRKNGEIKMRLNKVHSNPVLAIVDYTLAGLRANLGESRLWKNSPHPFMVPTRFSFLGLVNVQDRGEPITDEELSAGHPFAPLLENVPQALREDMTSRDNFCRYNSRVCILDYGSPGTVSLLAKTPPARMRKLFPHMA